MTEGEYTSATYVVVDSHAARPPVLPRMRARRWCLGVAQPLMLSVVLCGIAIAACFIHQLYRPNSGSPPRSSNLSAGEGVTSPTERPSHVLLPSKPVAHLTDGADAVHRDQIMAWSLLPDPLLYEMEYKDGNLVILKQGFYYVYSKVSFLDQDEFRHNVNHKCKQYIGIPIPLLTFRKRSLGSSKESYSNSYLGGVFELHKGDALFVEVSDTSKILRYRDTDNIFGAYMI